LTGRAGFHIVCALVQVGSVSAEYRPTAKGVKRTVIQVRVRKGETVDKALKRLKKIMDKEGMMKQLRANRYFEKPSEKKRRKAARARSRLASG
jgi:small subunit ribosomal protein S21